MLTNQMPQLTPIPITTRGLRRSKKLSAWLFQPRRWRLARDWVWKSPSGEKYLIRQGFVFTGSTIPRLLWWLLPPTGLLLIPLLVHEHGYKNGYLEDMRGTAHFNGRDRDFWDGIFKMTAVHTNGSMLINDITYYVIRSCGWFTWGYRNV